MRQVRTKWTQGSFLDKFNRAAMYLGYKNIPLAWGVATVPWDSMSDMESFLETLTTSRPGVE